MATCCHQRRHVIYYPTCSVCARRRECCTSSLRLRYHAISPAQTAALARSLHPHAAVHGTTPMVTDESSAWWLVTRVLRHDCACALVDGCTRGRWRFNGHQRGFGAQIAIDPDTSKWIGSGPIGRQPQHRRGKPNESGLWRVCRFRPYKQEVGGSSPSPPIEEVAANGRI
jgi:hypothetical protein